MNQLTFKLPRTSKKVIIEKNDFPELRRRISLLRNFDAVMGQLFASEDEAGNIVISKRSAIDASRLIRTIPSITFNFKDFKSDKTANETEGLALAGLWEMRPAIPPLPVGRLTDKEKTDMLNYCEFLEADVKHFVKVVIELKLNHSVVRVYASTNMAGSNWVELQQE